MNNQTNHSSEEIDLFYLFKLIGDFFKKCFIAAYRFIVFLLKNWIILLVLIVLGAVGGYFSQKKFKPSKETQLLTRINYNTVSYVYEAIAIYNKKVSNRDSVFLKKVGLWDKNPLVTNASIAPVLDFDEITTKYGRDNRTLEMLFEDYEFENENTLNTTLKLDFKYHNIDLILSHNATPKAIDKFIGYLNNTPMMEELKSVGYANIQELIATNEKTINQIDQLLNKYSTIEENIISGQVILDKDLTGLVNEKISLKEEVNELKEELIFSKNISVPLTKSALVENKPSIVTNKIITYPLILILLFLLIVLLKKAFEYAKKLAKEEEVKKSKA